MKPFVVRRIWIALCFLSPTFATAQRGGFVTTLGTDTVQVESFTREGARASGVLALRVPTTRLLHWSAELQGHRLTRYTQWITDAAGRPLAADSNRSTMVFTADSILVDASRPNGERLERRVAATGGAYPMGTVPISSLFFMLELALQDARHATPGSQPALVRMLPGLQAAPSRTPLHLARPDSVEVDYFGQGRFGVAFDGDGRLVRSDWSGTTVKVRVTRVADAAPLDMARRWAALDAAGRAFGQLSPRDTARLAVGTATVLVDYSRPAVRGRDIWGTVVPWNRVWRLGANFATHLHTDRALRLGDIDVPAGSYTLWMLPSPAQSFLIINTRTNIFGTQYDAGADLVRVPLVSRAAEAVEHLTVLVRDGRFIIAWGDREFSAGVTSPAAAPPLPADSLERGRAWTRWMLENRPDSLWGVVRLNATPRGPFSSSDALAEFLQQFQQQAGAVTVVSEQWVWRNNARQFWTTVRSDQQAENLVIRWVMGTEGQFLGFGANVQSAVPPVDSAGPVLRRG